MNLPLQIGFSINEILALATLATGACWLAWRWRTRRLGAVPEKKPLWVMEESAFSLTHAEVGACVLGIWGLPVAIIEGVALHHYPSRFLSKNFSALTAVHIANAWDQEQHGKGKIESQMLPEVDMNYMQELELADRLPDWRAACKLPPIEEKPPVEAAPTGTPDTSTLLKQTPLAAAA